MKTVSKRVLTVLCLASLAVAEVAMAGKDLILKVNGKITAGQKWTDENGNPMPEAWFTFEDVAGAAERNLDSKPVKAKLANAPSEGALIDLTRPSSCAIGGSEIDDSHVQVLQGGEVIPGDTFTIPNSEIQTFNLRFSKDGRYGAKEGDVTCTDGVMTFSAT